MWGQYELIVEQICMLDIIKILSLFESPRTHNAHNRQFRGWGPVKQPSYINMIKHNEKNPFTKEHYTILFHSIPF